MRNQVTTSKLEFTSYREEILSLFTHPDVPDDSLEWTIKEIKECLDDRFTDWESGIFDFNASKVEIESALMQLIEEKILTTNFWQLHLTLRYRLTDKYKEFLTFQENHKDYIAFRVRIPD